LVEIDDILDEHGDSIKLRCSPTTVIPPCGTESGIPEPTPEPEPTPIAGGGDTPVGGIIMYGGTTAPDNWFLCNGAEYDTETYTELFAVIAYTFGGAGEKFRVPSGNGRSPIGTGNAGTPNTTNRTLGTKYGSEKVDANHGHILVIDQEELINSVEIPVVVDNVNIDAHSLTDIKLDINSLNLKHNHGLGDPVTIPITIEAVDPPPTPVPIELDGVTCTSKSNGTVSNALACDPEGDAPSITITGADIVPLLTASISVGGGSTEDALEELIPITGTIKAGEELTHTPHTHGANIEAAALDFTHSHGGEVQATGAWKLDILHPVFAINYIIRYK